MLLSILIKISSEKLKTATRYLSRRKRPGEKHFLVGATVCLAICSIEQMKKKKNKQILPIKTNFWENKTQVGELVRGKKKKKVNCVKLCL